MNRTSFGESYFDVTSDNEQNFIQARVILTGHRIMYRTSFGESYFDGTSDNEQNFIRRELI